MPNRFAKLVATGFCLVMVVMASRQAEVETQTQVATQIQSATRGPASINSKRDKMAILKPATLNDLIHTEKVHGPLRATLEAVGQTAVAAGETIVLRGVLSSKEQVSNVTVKWIIPDGLELVSGRIQDTIALLQPGQPVNFELTLRKLTATNDQVDFLVQAAKGSLKFGDAAQYNTVDQEYIESRKKRLVESNRRIIEEQRALSEDKEQKIFH